MCAPSPEETIRKTKHGVAVEGDRYAAYPGIRPSALSTVVVAYLSWKTATYHERTGNAGLGVSMPCDVP
jgi:hypothetical protein